MPQRGDLSTDIRGRILNFGHPFFGHFAEKTGRNRISLTMLLIHNK